MFIIPPFALKQKYEKKNIENYERSNKYILSAAGFFSSFLQSYRHHLNLFFLSVTNYFIDFGKKVPDRTGMLCNYQYTGINIFPHNVNCASASDSGSQAVDVMEVV